MTQPLWSALVDTQRRALLDALRPGPQSVGDLVADVGLSQPATSKHLRVLRDAGLVSVRGEGRRRIYSVDPSGMSELDAWLAPYRRLWNDSLDALGRYLDGTDDARPDPA